MKDLQLVPGTTPKGTGIVSNQILSQKQLWVGQQRDEIDQVPMIWLSSARDINHASLKRSLHLNPSGQRSGKSNRQLEISQEPTPIDYWTSVANQGYEETKETCDQMHPDVLL